MKTKPRWLSPALYSRQSLMPALKTQYVMRYDDEVRNVCWNCDKNFVVHVAEFYLPIEKGQKVYLYCNHCGKINHL